MTTEPSKKPAERRWLRFRLGYAVILAIVVLFSVSFVRKALEVQRLDAQVAAASAQTNHMVSQNRQLALDIKRYRTLSFVYQQAREWGYVKPGDRPVIIATQYQHRARAAPPNVALKHSTPTWQRWWNTFFGSSSSGSRR